MQSATGGTPTNNSPTMTSPVAPSTPSPPAVNNQPPAGMTEMNQPPVGMTDPPPQSTTPEMEAVPTASDTGMMPVPSSPDTDSMSGGGGAGGSDMMEPPDDMEDGAGGDMSMDDEMMDGAGGDPGMEDMGGGDGTCEKGRIMASEVVIMGESFYAIAPQYIQNRIQDNARQAGALGANESYRNVAVSGQNMNYIANNEWNEATAGGASVKFVIMDGGGIDCLGGGCPACATTFQGLLDKMAEYGVEDVIYTRYPEPGAPPGSNASLKACLDGMQPDMQAVCEGSTAPVCHWVDLRPVWVDGDTTDGLHPTQSGGEHVGDRIWEAMVDLCLAQ